jgi:molybdenum cofactor cytidylyltransferase
VVVLGARASRLAARLRMGPPVMVLNRRWREGMSTSLAAGLARLPRSARGALVLLADQHALQASDLRSVMAAWEGKPGAIAASEHHGVLGPPVILPRAAFADARRLTGDAGARALLRSGKHLVVPVPVPAAAPDLDERADLHLMKRRGQDRRPP